MVRREILQNRGLILIKNFSLNLSESIGRKDEF